jgi:hypothetical protein
VKSANGQPSRRTHPRVTRVRHVGAPASSLGTRHGRAAIPAKPAQKRSRWQKVFSLSTLKLLGAFLLGAGTLAIAYLTYQDTHRADVSSITEQRQHDAEGVSFAEGATGKANLVGSTIITNNSIAPVHFVVFSVDVVLFNHTPSSAPVIKTFAFSLFNIPACSIGSVNIQKTESAKWSSLWNHVTLGTS